MHLDLILFDLLPEKFVTVRVSRPVRHQSDSDNFFYMRYESMEYTDHDRKSYALFTSASGRQSDLWLAWVSRREANTLDKTVWVPFDAVEVPAEHQLTYATR